MPGIYEIIYGIHFWLQHNLKGLIEEYDPTLHTVYYFLLLY